MNQSTNQPNRKAIYVGVAMILLGGAGVVVNVLHNSRQIVRPLEVVIDSPNPPGGSGDFVADRSDSYDIEVEIDWLDPPNEVRQLVSVMGQPSALDLRWTVTSAGQPIGGGTAEDYSYIRFESALFARVKDRLLGLTPDAKVAMPTLARGIGRFRTTAGQRYELTARIGDQLGQLAAYNPQLVVRLNRISWSEHTAKTRPLGYGGLAAIAVGLALLVSRVVAERITGGAAE